MAGFDAGKAVEPLDYDLTAFGGSKGRIPEPSTGAVSEFFQELRVMAVEVKNLMGGKTPDGEDLSDSDAAEIMAQMSDTMVQDMQDRIYKAIDGLCGGTPPIEEIQALPYRVLGAFNAWLGAQLRPEAQRPATRA